MLKTLFILLTFWVGNITAQPIQDSIDAKAIIERVLLTFNDIKSTHFKMKSEERTEDGLEISTSIVKMEFSPRKMYIQMVKENGDKGAEILFIEGKNNDKALLSPNAFPYFNMNLDPYGSLMRTNRHHTLMEAGGKYMADLISHSFNSALKKNFDQYYVFKGLSQFEQIPCYEVHILNPQYKYFDYVAKQYETIRTISREFHVSEYKLVESNPNIDNFEDIHAGKKIQIPNSYAQKIILKISTSSFVPVFMELYDDLGLFSRYSYSFFKVNPVFSPDTFSEKNPDYGF